MFNKSEENQRISEWLVKLNTRLPGFVKGDQKLDRLKTADFVNHSNKIVIELKREKGENLDNKDHNTLTLSNRIEGYVKDSNKKFKNYPDYQTLLIIELISNIWSAEVIMNGVIQLHFINGQHIGNSIKNERMFSKMENIGAIIFWPAPGNFINKTYYFDNLTANKQCKVTFQNAREILGTSLELLRKFE